MARYEDLRRTAGEGSLDTTGSWGLALFLRQGLAAWMRAWPEHRGDDPPTAKPTSAILTPPPALPASLSGQIVAVLANMVFTARQEVRA